MGIKELSQLIGAPERTIRAWVKKGCPHAVLNQGQAGKEVLDFNPEEVKTWRDTVKAPAHRPRKKQPTTYEEARQRKTLAQAELAELQLQKERGAMVAKADAEAANVKKFTRISNELDGLHTKVCWRQVGKSLPEMEEILKQEVAELKRILFEDRD